EVEKTGFSKFSTADVPVNVNARQRVDAALQVGAVSETVEVTGAAATLETDSSEKGQVVHTQQIVELPLNGRNFSDLALFGTNVHKSIYAYAVPPREGAFNTNGLRSTYNNFLLDGLDNNAYSTSNQGFSNQVAQPSPDAIAEFKVITSNYSAEYGRVGGAVVNAVMRSGTNQWHGSTFEFLRNTSLNAKGYQFSPAAKPTLQRNQFGASLGGPVIKNKVFFFGDYEGFRQLQRYLNYASLPDVDARNGLIICYAVPACSANGTVGTPIPVVNPLTGIVYPAGTPIPVGSLNPFAATGLSGLPALNGPG